MNKPNERNLLIISEYVCKKVVDQEKAFAAVEKVFASMASGDAKNFPVVRQTIGYADAIYGFKSGFDSKGLVLGLKSGGYWPNNLEAGLTNHQSTICLFDPDTGCLKALVGGNYLTAVRTAAASAVSIAHLARKDVSTIGILGAGYQSAFQLRAAATQRNFKKVIAWNRTKDKLNQLADVAKSLNLDFEAVTSEQLAADADVIITITSAFESLLANSHIKPGIHLACMGSDTIGKQEVDPQILARARVFTDEIEQSITLGEAQHAFNLKILKKSEINPIGDVINGQNKGRISDDEVTLFDGTGVGLQDLAVASTAVNLAEEQGLATKIIL